MKNFFQGRKRRGRPGPGSNLFRDDSCRQAMPFLGGMHGVVHYEKRRSAVLLKRFPEIDDTDAPSFKKAGQSPLGSGIVAHKLGCQRKEDDGQIEIICSAVGGHSIEGIEHGVIAGFLGAVHIQNAPAVRRIVSDGRFAIPTDEEGLQKAAGPNDESAAAEEDAEGESRRFQRSPLVYGSRREDVVEAEAVNDAVGLDEGRIELEAPENLFDIITGYASIDRLDRLFRSGAESFDESGVNDVVIAGSVRDRIPDEKNPRPAGSLRPDLRPPESQRVVMHVPTGPFEREGRDVSIDQDRVVDFSDRLDGGGSDDAKDDLDEKKCEKEAERKKKDSGGEAMRGWVNGIRAHACRT